MSEAVERRKLVQRFIAACPGFSAEDQLVILSAMIGIEELQRLVRDQEKMHEIEQAERPAKAS